MNDLSQSGRFVYLQGPVKNPGTCCVCGSPHKPVVDFGANLHQRASVWVLYLCIDCVTDAYNTMDIGSGRRAEREAAASHSFKSELESRNMVAITREQLDALIFHAAGVDSTVDDIVGLDVEDEPEVASESDGKSPESSDGFSIEDRESTEPVPTLAL